MLPSFVTKFRSSSSSEGAKHVFSLDLGGTNFRVSRWLFAGGAISLTDERKFAVPMSAMQGNHASDLFDFLAECIGSLQTDDDVDPRYGFTFSFPSKQISIDNAKLISWTKGFTTPGVVGEDVVALLHASMRKKGVRGTVVALINDTVGTLCSRTFSDPSCKIGVILGTGTNAAYVERVENIKTLDEATRASFGPDAKMVINMENGAFGDTGKTLPVSRIDREVDAASLNPGQQTYEKMVSGMYLGEITRRAVLRLMRAREIWNGVDDRRSVFDAISTPGSFGSFLLSEIDYDMTDDLVLVKQIEETKLSIRGSTVEDRKLLKEMCSMVIDRAARLTACVIAATSKQIGDDETVTAGVDGSVYQLHPSFRQRLMAALRILGSRAQVVLSKDGSGRGAAICAECS